MSPSILDTALHVANTVTKKKKGFTAPDGSFYEWTKPTPPTQADIDAIVKYHEGQGKWYTGLSRATKSVPGMDMGEGPKPKPKFTKSQVMAGIEEGKKQTRLRISGPTQADLDQAYKEGRAKFIKRYGFDPDQNPAKAAQIQAQEFQDLVGGVIAPITKPLGNAFAAMSPLYQVAEQTGLVKPGTGGELATGLATNAISAPNEIAADLGVLIAPKSSIRDRAGATANIGLNTGLLNPFDAAKVGVKAVKGLKNAAKGVDYVGDALKGAEGSGIPKRDIKPLKQAKEPPPAATPKTPEASVKPGASSFKEPWEMTKEEYAATNPDITTTQRNLGFVADHSGVRSTSGMSKAAAKAFEKKEAERFAKSGAPTSQEVTRKPNYDLESNRAAVRRDHLRAVTKAVTEGKPVPQRVLDEYPDLKPPQKTVQAPKPTDTQPAVALANKSTDTVKKLIGEPGFNGVKKETMEQWAKTAHEKGYTNPASAHNIAKSINDGTKRVLDNEETVGLASALHDLSNQFDDLTKRYNKSLESGGDSNLAAQLDDVTEKLSDIAKAGNKSGTEWGRSGVARQALMKADGSFEGVLARRQRTADGRKLTSAEIAKAKADADELTSLRTKIAEMEASAARTEAEGVVKANKPNPKQRSAARERVRLEREAIHKEIDQILKEGMVANDLGNVVYNAARLGGAAGRLAVNYAREGVVVLDEVVEKVIKDFADRGVSGVTRQDVIEAMTDARKRKATDTAKSATDEANNVFAQARKERQDALSLIKQRESEVRTNFQKAERKKAFDALKKEREQIEAEARTAREAESAFWKNVRDEQRGFDEAARRNSRLDREAAIRRWKASVGGQRAQVMNRIDAVQEKLDYARSEGALLGQKSALKPPDDPVLHELRVKEASVLRQMRLEDHRIRSGQEKAKLTKWDKAVALPGQTTGLLRNMVTMADVSWSGIQGAVSFYMNPRAWARGAKGSVKNLFAKNVNFVEEMESLRKDTEFFDKVIATGVDLPGLQPGHVDEFFAQTFADSFPIYRNIKGGSQQAYDAAATLTRFGLVKSWIRGMEASGRPLSPEALKVLGDAANTLTGKGSGKLAKAAASVPSVGNTLFAPSWWISQFEGMSGKPVRDAIALGYRTGDWRPAKLMSKEYAKIAGGAAATLTATAYGLKKAKEMGLTDWELDTDPNSKRFGKMWVERSGEVVTVDFLPPQMSNPIKFLFQATGGTRKDDGSLDTSSWARSQLLGQTFEGKYGPGLSLGLSIKDSINATNDPNDETGLPKYPYGRNMDPRTGEGAKNIASRMTVPISVQQGYGAATSENLSTTEKVILGFLSFFGRGPNVYKKP